MTKIVDFEERRITQQLKPLARILYRLVGACRRLIQQQPDDPELDEIKCLIAQFEQELQHGNNEG
jgi:hypothetical protein